MNWIREHVWVLGTVLILLLAAVLAFFFSGLGKEPAAVSIGQLPERNGWLIIEHGIRVNHPFGDPIGLVRVEPNSDEKGTMVFIASFPEILGIEKTPENSGSPPPPSEGRKNLFYLRVVDFPNIKMIDNFECDESTKRMKFPYLVTLEEKYWGQLSSRDIHYSTWGNAPKGVLVVTVKGRYLRLQKDHTLSGKLADIQALLRQPKPADLN